MSQYAELLGAARGAGPAAVLAVAIFGDQNMGSFQDVVPMEDGKRFVKAKDEMYGVVQERDANGEWKTTRTLVKLYEDRQLNRTVVLSDDDLRRLQGPTITPGTPLPPQSTPGVVPASDRERNAGTPGLEAGAPAAPAVTTTPITPIDASDLLIDKSNSQALGENLRNAGDYPPKGYEGYEPHHMVPSNAGGLAMDAVRQKLQSFGMTTPKTSKAKLADYSNLDYNPTPVFSERARQMLGPHIDGLGPWLKLECEDAPYWLFNITNVVDAIDEAKAELLRYEDGGVMRIARFAFDAERLRGQLMFTPSQRPSAYNLVTEEFVKLVQQYKLTGFDFKLLWSDEEDAGIAKAA